MNYLTPYFSERVHEQAIFNLLLYLIHKDIPKENTSLLFVLNQLDRNSNLTDREYEILTILKNAVNYTPSIVNSRILNLTVSETGLTACAFIKSDRSVSVVFKGTGMGEWIDNGEGLSGIPEENTYNTYRSDGSINYSIIKPKDFATDQQVEALNWFHRIAAQNKWNPLTDITLSGHSKGGNKAQFITANSDLVELCFSFNGHGFSPEALASFQKLYGTRYTERIKRIRSFSTENDYVSVLGEKMVPKENIYFFKSRGGFHPMETLFGLGGKLRPQCEQGRFSAYVESLSKDIMHLNPIVRQNVTLGIMNIFQKYMGAVPVNEDFVSSEKTFIGIVTAVSVFLKRLKDDKMDV